MTKKKGNNVVSIKGKGNTAAVPKKNEGGNVVTHEKFALSDEAKRRIAAAGVEVGEVLTDKQVADMKLREPQYGEALQGDCTVEEASIFYELFKVQRELDDRARNAVGAAFQKIGGTIASSDRNKSISEAVESGEVKLAFDKEEDAETFYRLQQKATFLHATFYWTVGERLGKHAERLGVRSKMRVVTVEPRQH